MIRDHALASGFTPDTDGILTRHDDVYVTTIEPEPDRDDWWWVKIDNLSSDAIGQPSLVLVDDDGNVLSTSGIDLDTFTTLYPELAKG